MLIFKLIGALVKKRKKVIPPGCQRIIMYTVNFTLHNRNNSVIANSTLSY